MPNLALQNDQLAVQTPSQDLVDPLHKHGIHGVGRILERVRVPADRQADRAEPGLPDSIDVLLLDHHPPLPLLRCFQGAGDVHSLLQESGPMESVLLRCAADTGAQEHQC